MLVLLVFAFKIASAAACAKHDFADLGLGGGADSIAVSQSDDGGTGEPQAPYGHAGTCSHCGCHHASAVPVGTVLPTAVIPHGIAAYYAGLPPGGALRQELRPPIA